jgi:HNH endonuclease
VAIKITDEPWIHRLVSHNDSGRENAFRDRIRTRDGKCVISGTMNIAARSGNWSHFEAAHIFPLEKESLWIQFNYGRWVTDMDDTVRVSKINSCQNGLIPRRDIHNPFDQYLISVNPDTVFLM